MLERRGPYRDAHLDRIAAGKQAEQILMSGPLGDPPNGAAIVFRGVEPAQVRAFVDADPYVQAGLVTSWRIEPWKLV